MTELADYLVELMQLGFLSVAAVCLTGLAGMWTAAGLLILFEWWGS